MWIKANFWQRSCVYLQTKKNTYTNYYLKSLIGLNRKWVHGGASSHTPHRNALLPSPFLCLSFSPCYPWHRPILLVILWVIYPSRTQDKSSGRQSWRGRTGARECEAPKQRACVLTSLPLWFSVQNVLTRLFQLRKLPELATELLPMNEKLL